MTILPKTRQQSRSTDRGALLSGSFCSTWTVSATLKSGFLRISKSEAVFTIFIRHWRNLFRFKQVYHGLCWLCFLFDKECSCVAPYDERRSKLILWSTHKFLSDAEILLAILTRLWSWCCRVSRLWAAERRKLFNVKLSAALPAPGAQLHQKLIIGQFT